MSGFGIQPDDGASKTTGKAADGNGKLSSEQLDRLAKIKEDMKNKDLNSKIQNELKTHGEYMVRTKTGFPKFPKLTAEQKQLLDKLDNMTPEERKVALGELGFE